jgi:hypothetical protein
VRKATYFQGFKAHPRSKVSSRGDWAVHAVAEELNISKYPLKNLDEITCA